MQTQPYNRRRLLQLLALTMTGAALPAATALATGEVTTTGDMQDTPPQPVYLPASGGKRGQIGAGSISFKLNKQQTSGLLGSTETMLPPGLLGAPPHSHQSFDEV